MTVFEEFRRGICRACPTPCEARETLVPDACARCPINRWRSWKCKSGDHAHAPTIHPRRSAGPGTILKRLLRRTGITPAPGCKCNARAAKMDAEGPDWCVANTEEIVGWLREEWHRLQSAEARLKGGIPARLIPFYPPVARRLIAKAVQLARTRAAKRPPAQP